MEIRKDIQKNPRARNINLYQSDGMSNMWSNILKWADKTLL